MGGCFGEPQGGPKVPVIAPQVVINATITPEKVGHRVNLEGTPDLGLVIGTQLISEAAKNDLNVDVLDEAEGARRDQEAPENRSLGNKLRRRKNSRGCESLGYASVTRMRRWKISTIIRRTSQLQSGLT